MLAVFIDRTGEHDTIFIIHEFSMATLIVQFSIGLKGAVVRMPTKARKGRTYLRDGRAPIPGSEATSRVMRANRGKDTRPEISLRKALWAAGLRGFRANLKGLPGRPDIVYTKQRLAIFVHGCFWHRCPNCQTGAPKTNTEFWTEKFERNMARDAHNMEDLRVLGWKTIIVWECMLKDDIDLIVREIGRELNEREVGEGVR